MKSLVNYINESADTVLRDLKQIVDPEVWDDCDTITADEMLQAIVDDLEDYGEKTSVKVTELDALNKFKKYRDVIVTEYNDENVDELSEQLFKLVDDDILFNKDSDCIFNGEHVDVYFSQFKNLLIAGVSRWNNSTDADWTFFLASNSL